MVKKGISPAFRSEQIRRAYPIFVSIASLIPSRSMLTINTEIAVEHSLQFAQRHIRPCQYPTQCSKRAV
jgi:hypothetical protein